MLLLVPKAQQAHPGTLLLHMRTHPQWNLFRQHDLWMLTHLDSTLLPGHGQPWVQMAPMAAALGTKGRSQLLHTKANS